MNILRPKINNSQKTFYKIDKNNNQNKTTISKYTTIIDTVFCPDYKIFKYFQKSKLKNTGVFVINCYKVLNIINYQIKD